MLANAFRTTRRAQGPITDTVPTFIKLLAGLLLGENKKNYMPLGQPCRQENRCYFHSSESLEHNFHSSECVQDNPSRTDVRLQLREDWFLTDCWLPSNFLQEYFSATRKQIRSSPQDMYIRVTIDPQHRCLIRLL